MFITVLCCTMRVTPSPAETPALQIEDLHVSYGPKRAVDGVSFEINKSEIFGLLGPNGAGKTTTLSAIEGLIRPDSGSIRIGGIDAAEALERATDREFVDLRPSARSLT